MGNKEYRIEIITEKFEEGYYWMISKTLETGVKCNCGFGYSNTIEEALTDAVDYFNKTIGK